MLEAILGPLAAPQPSTESGSDLRTSDQRRADALVEVCRRAAAAGGYAPTTAKAAVVVTMDFQDLKEPDRGRDDADRGPPGARNGAADRLRRLHHPRRARVQVGGAGPGPDPPAGHPGAVDGAVPARPGLHLPRLFAAAVLVRRPSLPALVRRRPDGPDQPGAALSAAPHDRAPEGLHRHRHHDRGHLAPVSCPAPRPATPGGSRRHARPCLCLPGRARARTCPWRGGCLLCGIHALPDHGACPGRAGERTSR